MQIKGLDKDLEEQITEMMDVISVSASLLDYKVRVTYENTSHVTIAIYKKAKNFFDESSREIVLSFKTNTDGSKQIKTVRFLFSCNLLSRYELVSSARKIKLSNDRFSKPIEKIIDSLGKDDDSYFVKTLG